jgi:hypothetical protein
MEHFNKAIKSAQTLVAYILEVSGSNLITKHFRGFSLSVKASTGLKTLNEAPPVFFHFSLSALFTIQSSNEAQVTKLPTYS